MHSSSQRSEQAQRQVLRERCTWSEAGSRERRCLAAGGDSLEQLLEAGDHDVVYVLVQAGGDGTLAMVSSGSVDVGVTNERLLGTSLYAGAGQVGHRLLNLSGAR